MAKKPPPMNFAEKQGVGEHSQDATGRLVRPAAVVCWLMAVPRSPVLSWRCCSQRLQPEAAARGCSQRLQPEAAARGCSNAMGEGCFVLRVPVAYGPWLRPGEPAGGPFLQHLSQQVSLGGVRFPAEPETPTKCHSHQETEEPNPLTRRQLARRFRTDYIGRNCS